MGRILCIDYGRKRSGIAVTDPLKLIPNGLETVPTKDIFTFLDHYFKMEDVEIIVVGYPKQMNNTASEAVIYINDFLRKFRNKFPDVPVELMDERFTSKMAVQSMVDAGVKKKQRQNKALIDKISATIILQSYLELKNFERNRK